MPIDPKSKLLLKSLKLKNFRCFEECEIKFEKKNTVILADNGNGKTAILDVIAKVLSMVTNSKSGYEKSIQPLKLDVRQKISNSLLEFQIPMKSDLHVQFGKEKFDLSIGKKSISGKEYWEIPAKLKKQLKKIANSNVTFPLITYYGIDRMRNQLQRNYYHDKLLMRRINSDRLKIYRDSLRVRSSIYDIEWWFREQSLFSDSSHHRSLVKDILGTTNTVKKAIEIILKPTDWSNLDWDPIIGELTVAHDLQGRLPLRFMSDGFKVMITLVADIAIRCISLNAQLENPVSETHGIVLIDELCLHLHPKWQQHVMELMTKIFPNIQFIVTSHSPLLVSTVNSSSIRVLHQNGQGFVPKNPNLQTQGVNVSDALATVMDVSPEPDITITKQLSEYKKLIENGKVETSAAKKLRSKLDNHFGDQHPLMIECEYLIEFQQFKLENKKQ